MNCRYLVPICDSSLTIYSVLGWVCFYFNLVKFINLFLVDFHFFLCIFLKHSSLFKVIKYFLLFIKPLLFCISYLNLYSSVIDFCVWCELRILFFLWGKPTVPASVTIVHIFTTDLQCHPYIYHISVYMWIVFWLPVLFHWLIWWFLCQDHSV